MLLFRNVKTGEIIVGAEDRVEQCHYAAVITRLEEELDNELTGGWKVIEVRSSCHGSTFSAYARLADGTEIFPSILVDFLTALSHASKLLLPYTGLIRTSSTTPLRIHHIDILTAHM